MSNDTFNSVTVNMSLGEVELELLNMKQLNQNLVRELDNCKQELHETKRQLSNSKAMELHLTSEIENLQESDKVSVLSKRIVTLEDELVKVKEHHMETIQQFEAELNEAAKEISKLNDLMKSELDNVNRNKQDEIYKYNEEISDLKSKLIATQDSLVEFEIKYESLEQQNTVLKQSKDELVNDNTELKQCLESKRDELRDCNEMVQNLQENVMMLQSEITNLKAAPVDKASKGNSLFAEVHDSRVQLRKYTEEITKKYSELKQKYNIKSRELDKMCSEYAILSKNLEIKQNMSEDQRRLEDTYKKCIERLESNIKALEKEISVRLATREKIMTGDMKCVEEMIEISRKEVLALRKELQSESLFRTLSEQSFHDSKIESRKWQTEALQLRAEMLILNNKLEEYKLQTVSKAKSEIISPPLQVHRPKTTHDYVSQKPYKDKSFDDSLDGSQSFEDIDTFFIGDYHKPPMQNMAGFSDDKHLYPGSSIFGSELDDKKENIKPLQNAQKKKVGFMECDTESKPKPIRNRKKVLVTPCVHISSINKNK